jgi:hypothetical protein
MRDMTDSPIKGRLITMDPPITGINIPDQNGKDDLVKWERMILVAIRPNMKPDIQKKSPDQSLSQY